MIEITFSEWFTEAGAGMFGTPRFGELHKAAEEGKLIVIGNKGERLIPTKIGESWVLQPEQK